MLELCSVSKHFFYETRKTTVLNKLSVVFVPGIFYAITGQSGAGKSTLLSLLAGTQAPDTGDIFFDGQRLAKLTDAAHADLLCSDIGLLFQYPHLLPELTIIENVAIKGIIIGMPKEEYTQRAQELLVSVGLAEYGDQSPRALSGGEQQRVALVRALFLQPKFLLADEPIAHLDDTSSALIIDLITLFQKKYNMAIIACSHNHLLTRAADVVYGLQDGQLIQAG